MVSNIKSSIGKSTLKEIVESEYRFRVSLSESENLKWDEQVIKKVPQDIYKAQQDKPTDECYVGPLVLQDTEDKNLYKVFIGQEILITLGILLKMLQVKISEMENEGFNLLMKHKGFLDKIFDLGKDEMFLQGATSNQNKLLQKFFRGEVNSLQGGEMELIGEPVEDFIQEKLTDTAVLANYVEYLIERTYFWVNWPKRRSHTKK